MIAQRRTQGSRPAADKEHNLRRLMREMRRVLVAYSGGVDSAYLALIATQELGRDAICITGHSPSVSAFQRQEAERTAREFDLNYQTVETDEINDPNYSANPANRCYFCKSELYTRLRRIADAKGISYILDGTNADDLGDFRPGRKAARENGVRSPLAELGFSKADIREQSRMHALPTWDKPASPCLASRIAYGVPVTIARLSKIERGEEFLRSLGLREFRVRVHGELARIEVAPDEMGRIMNTGTAALMAKAFREIGFRFVTLDLEGFRSGALNDATADIKNDNKEE